MKSAIEETFAMHVRASKLPPPVREYRFHAERRWRFDFCWPDRKVAVECEGATWTNGRHTRGSGYAKDLEKYNAAQMLGWKVFRCTADMVKRGIALELAMEALT